jgi:hypothetical protein
MLDLLQPVLLAIASLVLRSWLMSSFPGREPEITTGIFGGLFVFLVIYLKDEYV